MKAHVTEIFVRYEAAFEAFEVFPKTKPREKKFAEMRLLVALLMSVVTVEGLVLSFRFVGFRFLLVSLLICIWVQIGAFEYFALPKEKIMT